MHSLLPAVKGSRATRAVVHCRMAKRATADAAKWEETSMSDSVSENVWFGNEAVGIVAEIVAFLDGIEGPL